MLYIYLYTVSTFKSQKKMTKNCEKVVFCQLVKQAVLLQFSHKAVILLKLYMLSFENHANECLAARNMTFMQCVPKENYVSFKQL